VVECKRVDADWIFLGGPEADQSPRHGRFLWMRTIITPKHFPQKSFQTFAEFPLIHGLHHSEFCVIEGQGKEKPLLERISGDLLQATAALADEDSNTARQLPQSAVCIYVPVVVTTASLVHSPVEPEAVSISDGRVDQAGFEEVPAVLFRKSLAAETARRRDASTLNLSKQVRERSVLVVHGENASEILANFEVNWDWLKNEYRGRFPWEVS
jgi:hypothetical protein